MAAVTEVVAIEAVGLVKRFGGVPALAGLELSVPAGGVLGLLGPNGAGKTTGRDLRRLVRVPTLIAFTTVQPILLDHPVMNQPQPGASTRTVRS